MYSLQQELAATTAKVQVSMFSCDETLSSSQERPETQQSRSCSDDRPDVLSLELELAVIEQRDSYSAGSDIQLQFGNDNFVQADADEALPGPQHCLDVPCNLPQGCLLQPALHHSSSCHVVLN